MHVLLDIPDSNIINALDAGSIAYWGDYAPGQCSHEALMADKSLKIKVVEEESSKAGRGRNHTMTRDKVRKALVLIGKKWPWHLEAILKDNSDAETGDVLIQVAIFGDIVYG